MIDPMVADIHTAVSALIRLQLPKDGALLARFMHEPWTVRRDGSIYVVTLDLDSTLVASISEDDVAWAVAVVQLHRGEVPRERVN